MSSQVTTHHAINTQLLCVGSWQQKVTLSHRTSFYYNKDTLCFRTVHWWRYFGRPLEKNEGNRWRRLHSFYNGFKINNYKRDVIHSHLQLWLTGFVKRYRVPHKLLWSCVLSNMLTYSKNKLTVLNSEPKFTGQTWVLRKARTSLQLVFAVR
jgi:hypothetical protein